MAGVTGSTPLPERLRPARWDQVFGQQHFFNERFRRLVETDRWTGFLFWGPPGTGKTTLARLVATAVKRPFIGLSAVNSGVKEIGAALKASEADWAAGRPSHVIFIDEVHRLNRLQQDVLLPYLENGAARFVGATTENPSFEINNAIASRCLIFHFEALAKEALVAIIDRALLEEKAELEPAAKERLMAAAQGDARKALLLLEQLLLAHPGGSAVTEADWDALRSSLQLYYDKTGEAHYDTISAFIKSVRGGDPDAALFYLARMIESGEDPLFLARRLVILASEDIGNANPTALVVANSAYQATHAIGFPEARIVLAQATIYLCCSEKSNASYVAIDAALEAARNFPTATVPMHLRNASTKAMKQWGYGKGYQYPHSKPGASVQQRYLPEELGDTRFYRPTDHGTEKRIGEFLRDRRGLSQSEEAEKIVSPTPQESPSDGERRDQTDRS